MHWLQEVDLNLFRLINLKLSNPVFDVVMPFASGNPFFWPLAILGGIVLIWKTGVRGLLFLVMVGLAVGLSDGVVCKSLNGALGRGRRFVWVHGAICRVGKGARGGWRWRSGGTG